MFATRPAGRIGRGVRLPPQFGQAPPGKPAAQSVHHVHSKEQMNTSGSSTLRSRSQHSQLGRISSTPHGTAIGSRWLAHFVDVTDSGGAPSLTREHWMIGLGAVARTALGLACVWLVMILVPDETDGRLAAPLTFAVVASVAYGWYFNHQLRGVYKARYPMARAGEALVLVAAMFLALFSIAYVTISRTDPQAFTEPLDAFTSYYFSLTVLATVGFGDITPVSTAARSVTMFQMALDIAFIAVVLRMVTGAAKRTIDNRRVASESEPTPD